MGDADVADGGEAGWSGGIISPAKAQRRREDAKLNVAIPSLRLSLRLCAFVKISPVFRIEEMRLLGCEL